MGAQPGPGSGRWRQIGSAHSETGTSGWGGCRATPHGPSNLTGSKTNSSACRHRNASREAARAVQFASDNSVCGCSR
jgi:hypothetical protein